MKVWRTVSAMMLLAVFAGCSSKTEVASRAEENTKPVTVTVGVLSAYFDEYLQELLAAEVKKKYPHITLDINRTEQNIDNILATGKIPDILIGFNGQLRLFEERKLLTDMTQLVKSENVNLESFESNYIQDIRRMVPESSALHALPYSVGFHAMYYNTDIFDRFGVTYPKDGMNWEQLIDLAKKVTRFDQGVQFRGLNTGLGITWMSQPLSLILMDNNTGKASINNAQWKKVFELYKSVHAIPGNELTTRAPKDQFLVDKTLAILLNTHILADITKAAQNGFNWDVAQYPSYPEKPNTYGNSSVNTMLITNQSQNKEQAMKVIGVAVSEPVQLIMSKRAYPTPLRSEAVKKGYGQDLPQLAGKNVAGIFKSKPVTYPVPTTYSIGDGVTKPLAEYMEGAIDVNTALSKAEEAINLRIAEEKAKQGK